MKSKYKDLILREISKYHLSNIDLWVYVLPCSKYAILNQKSGVIMSECYESEGKLYLRLCSAVQYETLKEAQDAIAYNFMIEAKATYSQDFVLRNTECSADVNLERFK